MFHQRSTEKELMDQEVLDPKELWRNLHELVFINKLTGGPNNTFQALKKLLKNETKEIHIVDIGFGAGDMLNYLLKNQHKLPCPIRLTGVDLMPEMKTFALEKYPQLKNQVTLEVCDFESWFKKGNKADVVINSLFCHHLSEEQIVAFFSFIKQNVRLGGITNDLVRSPIAYYGIKLPTQLFSSSTYTKNDAPVSVLRGFHRTELEELLQEAKIPNYSIKWKWAFRYLITIKN